MGGGKKCSDTGQNVHLVLWFGIEVIIVKKIIEIREFNELRVQIILDHSSWFIASKAFCLAISFSTTILLSSNRFLDPKYHATPNTNT